MSVYPQILVKRTTNPIGNDFFYEFTVTVENEIVVFSHNGHNGSFSHLEWNVIKEFIDNTILNQTKEIESPKSRTSEYCEIKNTLHDKVNDILIWIDGRYINFHHLNRGNTFNIFDEDWSAISNFINEGVNNKNLLRQQKKLPMIRRIPPLEFEF